MYRNIELIQNPSNGLFNVKTVSRLSQNVVATDEQREAADE